MVLSSLCSLLGEKVNKLSIMPLHILTKWTFAKVGAFFFYTSGYFLSLYTAAPASGSSVSAHWEPSWIQSIFQNLCKINPTNNLWYVHQQTGHTHHTPFFFLIHKTTSIFRSLQKKNMFLKCVCLFKVSMTKTWISRPYFSGIQQFFYLSLSFSVIFLQAA